MRSERPSLAPIPRRLEIENRSELEQFPLNILFGTVVSNVPPIIATAFYQPKLESYQFLNGKGRLVYYNTLDDEWTVVITKGKKIWEGEKLNGSKKVLRVIGSDWKNFFTQLTISGINDSEPYSNESSQNFLRRN